MQPLYTDAEFKASKSRQLLPLKCEYCKRTFYCQKNFIQRSLTGDHDNPNRFCSHKCSTSVQWANHSDSVLCKNCGKQFTKQLSRIKKHTNHFCSRSCAATWNNTHKTKGTRRSKLEVWLEQQLKSKYKYLPIDFNKTDAINAELDIYFPSLKLAFELNGIFHYEPIYGLDKLTSTQSNDHRKMLACAERYIELCVLDVSLMKNFKPIKAQKYLDIVANIIQNRLG